MAHLSLVPEVRFVTPALHDCKGFMTYVFKVIDKPTTTLLLSVAPSSFSEKNFTGDQVQGVDRGGNAMVILQP